MEIMNYLEFYSQIKNTPFYKESTVDFNGEYKFFYDETNNARVLRIKDSGSLNKDKDEDFILGGIVLKKDSNVTSEEFEFLKSLLKVNKQEIKLKSLGVQSKGFIECIKSRKVRTLLKWINEKPIFIHYKIWDDIYYMIADIIDAGVYSFEHLNDSVLEQCMVDFSRKLKTLLNLYVYQDLEKFLQILKSYKYPLVEEQYIEEFYKGIIDFIESAEPIEIPDFLGITRKELISYLKSVAEEDFVPFINNKTEDLVFEYADLYLQNALMLRESFHIFDEENVVQEKINNLNLPDEILSNFKFENSEFLWELQISDCMVGIINKFIKYIKPLKVENISNIEASLKDEYEKEGVSLFKMILKKSYEECEAFKFNSSNLELENKLCDFFGYLD